MNPHRLFNLPNCMTLFRFPASPLMAWFILSYDASGKRPETAWISIAIGILAILVFLSDFYDGRVARHFGIVTDFGKIMDPIADSTFFMSLLFAFAAAPRFQLSIWFGLLVLYREVAIQILRRYAALTGTVLAAGWAGKLKMLVQSIGMGCVAALILLNDWDLWVVGEECLRAFVWWVSLGIVIVNLVSLAVYAPDFPRLIRAVHERPLPESPPSPPLSP